MVVFREPKETTLPKNGSIKKAASLIKANSNANTRSRSLSPLNLSVSPPASEKSLLNKSSSSERENPLPHTVIPVDALEYIEETEDPVRNVVDEKNKENEINLAKCHPSSLKLKQEAIQTDSGDIEMNEIINTAKPQVK